MSQQAKVAVVGGGPWGLALARASARAGAEVTLISRRDPSNLEKIRLEREIPSAAAARLIVLAVPSVSVSEVIGELGPHLDGGHFLLHGVRGLAGDQLHTLSEVIRSLSPVRRIGALGGPVLVDELTAGKPSVMVVGSAFREVLAVAREAFEHPALRLYMTRDLTGLEWASALTAVVAIAVGFAVASGLGPGLVAAFTTRAIHETSRIVVAAGGDPSTVLGLAGLGDLLAAINQPGRPEVAIGAALARGASLDQARSEVGMMRVEALELLPRLLPWLDAHKVRAPIICAIADAVLRGVSRQDLIARLMTEPLSQADRDPRG